ncbi:UNVERIFIED_CONTAM: hypothetical protein K2H54_012399 [Gekko kuhli]
MPLEAGDPGSHLLRPRSATRESDRSRLSARVVPAAGFHRLSGALQRRHIDTQYHLVRDLQKEKVVKLIHCPSEDLIADALTKPLLRESFGTLRSKMNLLLRFS